MKSRKLILLIAPLLMLNGCSDKPNAIDFNKDDYALIHIYQITFDEDPIVVGEFGYYYLLKGKSLPLDVGELYGYRDLNSLTPPTYSIIEYFTSIDPLTVYDQSAIYEDMDIYMRFRHIYDRVIE